MKRSKSGWRAPLLVFAAAGLSACGERDPDPEDVQPVVLLEQAAERMESVGAFAFLLEHENGTTTIVRGLTMDRAEGRVAEGNRMQAELRSRAGPVNVNLRVIILPEGAWLTNPFTGQWEPEAFHLDQLFDPGTGVTALLRDLSDPRIVGRETVGGVPTHRVEASVSSEELTRLVPAAMAGRTLLVRLWVGEADPVVHRVEIVGALEPQDGDALVRRITLSDFGSDFSIEAPRP